MRALDKMPGSIIFYSGGFDKTEVENNDPVYQADAGEELNARVILSVPLEDHYDRMNWNYDHGMEKFSYNYALNFYIDGEHRFQWLDELPRALFEEFSFYDFVIIPPADEKLEYSLYVSDWVDIIEGLSPGMHEVKVEFLAANNENPPGQTEPLATGKFILNAEEVSMKKFVEDYRILLPEATLYSEEISRDVIRAAQGAFDDKVPIAAVIVEPTGEWQFTHDATGRVLRRHITAAVALSGVEDECFVRTALFSQEMIEQGLYRDLRFVKELEDFYHYELPCENVFRERKKQ